MTKRNVKYLLASVAILASVLFFKEDETFIPTSYTVQTPKSLKLASSQTNQQQTRLPSSDRKEPESIKASNFVSDVWEENLEHTLRAQGGPTLKEVKIDKLDSFVWKQDGIALHVETVRITLTNENKNQTTFKVMVDSQTGKILKNWDHPVFDPANPREKFKLALDPRYHND